MSGELIIQKFILIEKPDLPPDVSKKLVDPIDNKVTAVDMDQVKQFQSNPRNQPHHTPGYFVFSTAPFNTEDGEAKLIIDLTPTMQDLIQEQIVSEQVAGREKVELPIREVNSSDHPEMRQQNFDAAIGAIAKDLSEAAKYGTPELVIAIHGYNTEQTNVRRWYKKIFQYVNQKPPLKQKKNLVFIGYRWSSERIGFDRDSFVIALNALPIVPLFLLIGGVFSALLCLIWANAGVGQWTTLLPTLLLFLVTAIASIIFSLVLLRIIVYFRDNYRASNFAVLDLVELIRQLDTQLAPTLSVNLSFIGHSMGGFVATNVIRILSDVFEPKAVDKHPSSDIGQGFCLKRLVLASPDIPVLAIAASRANFLAASLRRFDEAYLFSNEGDLALRLAATAANYFSFPARTRDSGYRLGNVTVIPGEKYGIVNLSNLKSYCPANEQIQFQSITQKDTALDFLFVSNVNGGLPNSLAELAKKRHLNSKVDQLTIADLFTYFDCTDYIETANTSDPDFNDFLKENKRYKSFIRKFNQPESSSQALGILSRAVGVRSHPKPRSLKIWDYAQLMGDFVKGRDVHGGYFAAPFSQKLIYQLAFMGFHELLSCYDANSEEAIDQFNQDCSTHWLQVLLSPLHYQSAYVQGEVQDEAQDEKLKENKLKAIKQELIEHISNPDRS